MSMRRCGRRTGIDGVADLHKILGDVALGHGGRERRQPEHLVRRQREPARERAQDAGGRAPKGKHQSSYVAQTVSQSSEIAQIAEEIADARGRSWRHPHSTRRARWGRASWPIRLERRRRS